MNLKRCSAVGKNITYNVKVLGEGWALVAQNFKFKTNEYRKYKH